jgi:hypothetical protein
MIASNTSQNPNENARLRWIMSVIFTLLIAAPAVADGTAEPAGVDWDQRGDRIEQRFDRRGDQANRHLDRKGAHVNRRVSSRGE